MFLVCFFFCKTTNFFVLSIGCQVTFRTIHTRYKPCNLSHAIRSLVACIAVCSEGISLTAFVSWPNSRPDSCLNILPLYQRVYADRHADLGDTILRIFVTSVTLVTLTSVTRAALHLKRVSSFLFLLLRPVQLSLQ